MVSGSKRFVSDSQACLSCSESFIYFSTSDDNDDVQPLPPKRIKKAMPGSPEYASQASVVTIIVLLYFPEPIYLTVTVFPVVLNSMKMWRLQVAN